MKKLLLTLTCTLLTGVSLTSCGGSKDSSKIKVGLITLHDNNSTYDANFIKAFEKACEEKGFEPVIKTNIPEGEACYEAAAELADDGCKFVFADSFGHESYLLKAAKEFKDVQFSHATGTMAHTENLDNFHNAFASIYEGRYLSGIVAGLKLQEMMANDSSVKPVLGYVGAFTYAEVISGYSSFYLGVKSIVNDVTMKVRFTGSWYDEVAEKDAAASLINDGCVIISQHADSWGAPTECESKGVPNVSYNGSTASRCPDTFLVSSRIDWQPYFEYCFDAVENKTEIVDDYVGGLGDTLEKGSVCLTELGSAATSSTKAKLEEVAAKLKSGETKVFDCSTFTVNNAPLTSYLADVDTDPDFAKDTEAIKTENGVTYFAESEFRSAPYFDVQIDGIELINREY